MSSTSRVVLGVGEEYDGILKVVEDQKKKKGELLGKRSEREEVWSEAVSWASL